MSNISAIFGTHKSVLRVKLGLILLIKVLIDKNSWINKLNFLINTNFVNKSHIQICFIKASKPDK